MRQPLTGRQHLPEPANRLALRGIRARGALRGAARALPGAGGHQSPAALKAVVPGEVYKVR